MIAALFLIETAKSELEEAGLPQAEAVSKASDILAETTEKIAHVIGEARVDPKTRWGERNDRLVVEHSQNRLH